MTEKGVKMSVKAIFGATYWPESGERGRKSSEIKKQEG